MEDDQENHIFFEVFGNEAIMHHLAAFLDMKSLKALRKVSRLFNGIVLSSKNFRTNSTITLNKSVLLDPALNSLSFQPAHLIIFPFIIKKQGNYQSITERVCQLAKGCRGLTFWDREHPRSTNAGLVIEQVNGTDGRGAKRRVTYQHCPRFLDIIVAARHITMLLLPKNAVYFLEQNLSREDQKQFRLPASLKEIYMDTTKLHKRDIGVFEQLSGLQRIGGYHNNFPLCSSPRCSCYWPSLKHLLGFHRNSLVELSFLCDRFWEQDPPSKEFQGLKPGELGFRLPNLRSLTIQIRPCTGMTDWIYARKINFWNAHISQLEKLSLVFGGRENRLVLDFPLVFGKNLKSLQMAINSVENSLALLYWLKEIRELPLLEQLILDSDCVRSNERLINELRDFDLFSYFPSSLRRFKIKLCNSLNILQMPFLQERRATLFVNPESLQRLSNLATLEIHGKAFGNPFVQGICTYLVSLKSLVIHSCAVTDDAFLEPFPQDVEPVPGPPLANLKNLTYLYLERNNGITSRVLLFGVKFQRLVEIRVDSCLKIEDAMKKEETLIFETLALNNPVLQIATFGFSPDRKVWKRPTV